MEPSAQNAQPPLTPLEQRLREAYLAQPRAALDQPCTAEAARQVIDRAFEHIVPGGVLATRIPEEHFFRKGNDVAVVRHLRYLPAVIHQHAFFELGCQVAGSCTNHIGDRRLEMAPGDVCIVSPGTSHAISAFSDDAILVNVLVRSSTIESAFSNVVLESDPLSGFFLRPAYGLPTRPFLFFGSSGNPDVDRYVSLVHQESHRDGAYHGTLLNSLVTALLVALFREYRDESENADQIAAVLRQVRENLATVTLSSLADHLAYSERHVQRILSTELDTTFSRLLQQARMERAAELIRTGALPIADIAAAVGYANPSTFRRMFKRHHKVTPAQYRASIDA